MITKNCKYCGKVIETYTDTNAEYLMLQHLISNHKNMIEIKEKEVKDGTKN